MNKYHNGKIYKIVDVGYNKCYIGSTTESLSRRMSKHRHQYKQHQEGKRSKMNSANIFDEFGVGNCKIELVEYCKCETKDELLRREGEIIKTCECVNKQMPRRTKKAHYEDNRERIKEYRKHKYQQSKDIIDEKHKNYYELHKEDIKQWNSEYRERN